VAGSERSPLAGPRFPGDVQFAIEREGQRLRRLSYLVMAFVDLVGLWVLLNARSLIGDSLGIGLILMALPLTALTAHTLMRRQVLPARDLLLRGAEGNLRAWQELDGGTPPDTPEAALARLEGRSDELATFTRIARLLEIGIRSGRVDRASVDSELDRWRPSSSLQRARHERLEAVVAYLDGTDDLGPAKTAIKRIEDPAARAEQTAALAIEEARRLIIGGRDPFPLLVATERELGPVDLPLLRQIWPTRRDRMRRLAVIGLLVLILIYNVAIAIVALWSLRGTG
jgi:hypothetical protein